MRRYHHEVGRAPGELSYHGTRPDATPRITVRSFDHTNLNTRTITDLSELPRNFRNGHVEWAHVEGLADVGLVQLIGDHFGIGSLFLEDVLARDLRPTIAIEPDYGFVTIRLLDTTDASQVGEHLAIAWGTGWIVSFSDLPIADLEPVIARLARTVPRERMIHSDYLAYAMMDALVDRYLAETEALMVAADHLDDPESIEQGNPMPAIADLKQHTASLRRISLPLREVIHTLQREDSALVSQITRPYLDDLLDHTHAVLDYCEATRDTLTAAQELYQAHLSQRMNEVMKVLTIIATIFIPLSFLAGVFGMNFDSSLPGNMPELRIPYGYVGFWIVALLMAVAMLLIFRRKRWL